MAKRTSTPKPQTEAARLRLKLRAERAENLRLLSYIDEVLGQPCPPDAPIVGWEGPDWWEYWTGAAERDLAATDDAA